MDAGLLSSSGILRINKEDTFILGPMNAWRLLYFVEDRGRHRRVEHRRDSEGS